MIALPGIPGLVGAFGSTYTPPESAAPLRAVVSIELTYGYSVSIDHEMSISSSIVSEYAFETDIEV